MKKKLITGIAIAAALAAIGGGIFYKNTRFELEINSQEIIRDEFLYVMNQQVYPVTQKLTQKNNVSVNSDFWTKEINGEIPYEKLADDTIEQLKYNRAVYEIAKEQGLVDEIDYAHMLERKETENKDRAEKIANGEAVYGLSEFTTELYMEYEMDSFQKKYCETLQNEGMSITDEERQAYYEENKDALFVKDDDITLDYVKIDPMAEGLAETQMSTFKNALTDIYKQIDADHSLKTLIEGNDALAPYFAHEEILSSEMSAKSRAIGDVIAHGYELGIGETTPIIDEEGVLYLIQCTAKKEYDYLPMEDVKDNIDKELRERHYNEIIEKQASQSEVRYNIEKIYSFVKKHITKR